MAIEATTPEPTSLGDTLEERLHLSMWRAKLTPPRIAELVGVTSQTVRNWQDPEHTARPRHSDVLMWAVATNTPVRMLDAEHPLASVHTIDDSGSDDDGPRTPPGTRTLNLVIMPRSLDEAA